MSDIPANELDRILAEVEIERLLVFRDPDSGLCAFLVIDDLTLGPAAGGTRTRAYSDAASALHDAAALARTMTLKCSIAGLDAGGGKMVVLDHPGLRRDAAFRTLGRRVQELGGLFTTAGDLGTTQSDLESMAESCSYVRTDLDDLSSAVGRGVAGCIAACARLRGRDDLVGLKVAVQGCGAVGSSVAAALDAAGAELVVADVNPSAARRVARATGAKTVDPSRIALVRADVFAPCATGGAIDLELADELPAWAVCGAANNVLSTPEVAERLRRRDILLVPDIIASAGAIIHGLCAFRGEGNGPELIDRLGQTAREVLERSLAEGRPSTEIAERRARRRIAERASSGRGTE